MTFEQQVIVGCAFALPFIFALAFAREARREGLRFPRGWFSRQRKWRKWVLDYGFSRNAYQDNRLARVMCYDQFVEKRPGRRARFYSKQYGFFYVGESLPQKFMTEADVRAMAKNVMAR